MKNLCISVVKSLFFLLAIGFQNQSNAQSSNLEDYVFIAGSTSCTNTSAANCGIVIGGNATIISGSIASPNQISTSNGVELNGEIYAGSKLNFGNSVSLNGTVYVENSSNSSSFVVTSGNNFELNGSIYSGGESKGKRRNCKRICYCSYRIFIYRPCSLRRRY